MGLKKIKGSIAAKPVVVSLETRGAVLVLLKTEDKLKKYCCIFDKVYTQRDLELAKMLCYSRMSDIVLSDVGDEVEMFIYSDEKGNPIPCIADFKNLTHKDKLQTK